MAVTSRENLTTVRVAKKLPFRTRCIVLEVDTLTSGAMKDEMIVDVCYDVSALINPQLEMRLDWTSKQMDFGSQDLPEHFFDHLQPAW